jgi:hypothetical protein
VSLTLIQFDLLLPARLTDRRVVAASGCWEWTGWHNDLGYGYVCWNGRDKPVHRVVMQVLGRVRDDQDVDHLCLHKECWNPEHLEAVSHQENMRRHYALKTECVHGHDYTDPANVYTRPNGRRLCRICALEQGRARRAAR